MNAAAIQNKPEVKPEVSFAPVIRVLKVATCPSLSGASQLSYQVGCDAESAIYFQVTKNSGGGQHNIEWVSMEKIGRALSESTAITSFSLHSIFKGKSLNNGGFLLAVLKHEGLVLASADEKVRSYQLGDPGKFMDEVKALIDSGVNLKVDQAVAEKPKKSASKTSQKKTIDPA